ncbi:hypothetical protein ACFVSW_03575 [Neobacillus sp. NPDC058068]|uniref:hypothetical protein n=1 Tax=Neobacillus sp. NPDC058068 TaxID=3346325 RepID=UPI0036D8807D
MNRQIAGIKIFWSFVYFLPASYRQPSFRKNENALQLISCKAFFYLYEQRGWEKFFTVKQKGYMFVVINFTYII